MSNAFLKSKNTAQTAHAAIVYTETSQSRHESMHMEANQANCMPFALKRNGLLWRVGGMYGCG